MMHSDGNIVNARITRGDVTDSADMVDLRNRAQFRECNIDEKKRLGNDCGPER